MQTGVLDPNSLDPDPAELSQDSALQGGERLPLTCERHKTLRFDDMTADSVIYANHCCGSKCIESGSGSRFFSESGSRFSMTKNYKIFGFF
jgi:hypothetical protein